MNMKSRVGRLLLSSVVGLLARGCGDDDSRPPSDPSVLDAGAHDAAIASLDASALDASAACLPIDQVYDFTNSGGLVAVDYYSEVAPDGTYRRVRTEGKHVTSCSAPLASCQSADAGIRTDQLRDALLNADVSAAFDKATSELTLIYGEDNRAADGQVFVVERGPDKRFGVGPACNGASGCLEVPSGVMALVTLLYHLDQQQGESGPCANF